MQFRLVQLDVLRGICALGVCFFHLLENYIGKPLNYNHPLSPVGYYAVSMFFLISGATLQYVYDRKNYTVKRFYTKRVFRIFPLLIICSLITFILQIKPYTFLNFIETATGIFSFTNWHNPCGIWIWSIGNELIFYLLFPLILFILNHKKYILKIILFLLIPVIFLFFKFQLLPLNVNSPEIFWKYYTFPAHQFIYFLVGICAGKYCRNLRLNKLLTLALLPAIFFLLYHHSNLPKEYLDIKFTGIIHSLLVLLIFLFVLKTKIHANCLTKKMQFLGNISYSLYMWHIPIIFVFLHVLGINNYNFFIELITFKIPQLFPIIWGIPIIICILVFSILSYLFIEKPMIKIGNKMAI